MQETVEYAALFRARPLRFIFPLTDMSLQGTFNINSSVKCWTTYFKFQSSLLFQLWRHFVPMESNLIKLPRTRARAIKLSNNNVFCEPEILCDVGCETPSINYGMHLGKKYSFFYAISCDIEAADPNSLIKVDVDRKTYLAWSEYNCYPSEPVFVLSPNAKVGSNQYILNIIRSKKVKSTYLKVYCRFIVSCL